MLDFSMKISYPPGYEKRIEKTQSYGEKAIEKTDSDQPSNEEETKTENPASFNCLKCSQMKSLPVSGLKTPFGEMNENAHIVSN